MSFKLRCREASRLLSEAEDHKLALGERVSLWLHVKACDACTQFERQLAVLRQAMRHYREPRD